MLNLPAGNTMDGTGKVLRREVLVSSQILASCLYTDVGGKSGTLIRKSKRFCGDRRA